jgi:hypothetical protein
MSHPKKRMRPSDKKGEGPAGTYHLELTNPQYVQLLGVIVSSWPHVEENMMQVFSELLSVGVLPLPVRQLYKSIVNARTRIDIMRNLLASPHNSTKDSEYDDLIREFEKLNKLRNTYLHGLWSTYEDGSVYIAETSMDDLWILRETRKVHLKELEEMIVRMKVLNTRIIEFTCNEMLKRAKSTKSVTFSNRSH